MKVSFGTNIKSRISEAKKKQDAKIMENVNTPWDRKKCTFGLITLSSALIDAATPVITKQLIKKSNLHPLSLNAAVGGVILAAGTIAGIILSRIDAKKNTKLGDFAYKFFNGRNAQEPSKEQ